MSGKKLKVAAATLGCKVNTYDTETILSLFTAKNYEIVDFEELADIYIVNTCSITDMGDKKSRQMIRRAGKQNPEAVIVVCGCYAQTAPDEVRKIQGVNIIVGTRDRAKIVEMVESHIKTGENIEHILNSADNKEYERLSVNGLSGRTRAFVKIQDGCDNFCSYCVVPYARGPARSRPVEEILTEVSALTSTGYKEIVLTGIHAASYGKDFKNIDLTDLLEMVHEIKTVERLRFSSIEPGAVDNKFINTLQHMSKICGHFHLSLQSGCDKTLKEMNRRYNTEIYAEAAQKLRDIMPNAAITTDIIVGFPGETDENFEKSLNFVESMRFAKLHVFKYSPKKGTAAANFAEQINQLIKEKRSLKMIQLGRHMEHEYIKSFIGRELSVLFETITEDGIFTGHADNYIEVAVKSSEDIINKIKTVRTEYCDSEKLIAYCTVLS